MDQDDRRCITPLDPPGARRCANGILCRSTVAQDYCLITSSSSLSFHGPPKGSARFLRTSLKPCRAPRPGDCLSAPLRAVSPSFRIDNSAYCRQTESLDVRAAGPRRVACATLAWQIVQVLSIWPHGSYFSPVNTDRRQSMRATMVLCSPGKSRPVWSKSRDCFKFRAVPQAWHCGTAPLPEPHNAVH